MATHHLSVTSITGTPPLVDSRSGVLVGGVIALRRPWWKGWAQRAPERQNSPASGGTQLMNERRMQWSKYENDATKEVHKKH